jgi:glycosyltransferase involved in cell wall biosynthesis
MASAGVFPGRLRHVPNFIDSSVMETKVHAGGGVVFAGRLSEEKGVDVLVSAGALLRAPIDIAGDGPRRAELERLAVQVGAEHIRFHGHLTKPSLHELIRGAAVTALPSRWYENQPLSVLDSFACAVPVVGSDLGGIPELINPKVDGSLVPPNDPVALASALQSFVDDPAVALAMGKAGRRKVEALFSPQVHMKRVDQLYQEAIVLAGGEMANGGTPNLATPRDTGGI